MQDESYHALWCSETRDTWGAKGDCSLSTLTNCVGVMWGARGPLEKSKKAEPGQFYTKQSNGQACDAIGTDYLDGCRGRHTLELCSSPDPPMESEYTP